MIRKLFLPEKIGSYYLFSKRVVALDIGPSSVLATVVRLKGRSRIIEKLFEEPISAEGGTSYEERVIHALRLLSHRLGTYDELCCSIPSTLAVFKNLVLPFTGLKKIKMVVPFEVEPLLPFALDKAVLDSIVTKEDTENQQTHVLVCAVPQEVIERYLHYFSSAGVALHSLKVDILELYGLHKLIEGKEFKDATIGLIDMEYEGTRLALIHKGELVSIRSLPDGLISIIRSVSKTSHEVSEHIQTLLRSGISETKDRRTADATEQAFEPLINQIRFTYTTALQKLTPTPELSQYILMGAAGDIPGIVDFLKRELGIPMKLVEPKKLIHNSVIQSNVSSLPNSFMLSIATALSSEVTADFNLNKKEELQEETHAITGQLRAAALLLLLILGSFTAYSFFRVRALRNAYKQGQLEALTALKKSFKLKPSQTTTLAQANKAAQAELKKQETAWHRLSPENRYAFLKNLSELSKCINIRETQLELTNLVISDTTIKLYGSVPGYPELTKLQNQLECPHFKRLPKLQDWNFKSDPITLTINKEES